MSGSPDVPRIVDPEVLREVLGHFASGVTAVTAVTDDGPTGFTCQSFSSLSLDPPLVAFMPTTGSGTYARLARATAYCINVLAHDQQDLCRTMATPGDDKFAGVAWHRTDLGAPALDDAVAQVHCTPEREVEAGDPTGRKRLCHQIDRMPTAATEVGDIRAGTQPFRKAVCHRQDDVDQRGVEHLAALLGHQLVEPRIFAIRHPAALLVNLGR